MDTPQTQPSSPNGHSATVQMRLHINGQSLPVVQAGDNALKLRDNIRLPEGPASLEIIVDGQSRQSAVTVLSSGDTRWIQISRSA
jgi:hypothetical protein